MYQPIFNHIIFPLLERYSGTTIQSYLNEFNKTQWWSKRDLENQQNKRLKSLITHAYENVPYYHSLFRTNGIQPDDIQSKNDLYKIPVLTKDTIRENYANLIAKNIKKSNFLERRSSGSTGEPLKFLMDRRSYSEAWAYTFRCWGWANYRLGDRYIKITHPRKSIQKKVQDLLMRCYIIPAFEINDTSVNEIQQRIRKIDPVLIRGFPSSIYILSKLLEKEGVNDLHVNSIMTTGDMLFPQYRDTIKKVFNCQIFDSYGGEGTAVAYECNEHDGYHISEEGVIVECLDKNGEPCIDELGELVITNLSNYSMPFIRYKIQDLGILTSKSCRCGRNLSIIRSIEGRSSDIIVTPRKKILTIHFFSTFLKHYNGISQYQIIQDKINQITINIVRDSSFKDSSTKLIIDECRSRIGEDMEINIEYVDQIPLLKSGKRRFVISNIPREF